MNESSNGNTEQTKKCGKCGEVKGVSLFHKDSSRRDGLYSYCKSCNKAHHKAYRQANKETIAEKKKAYRQANKEAIAERMRGWYQANKEAIAEKHKAYYQANKESVSESHKAYRQANKEAIAEKKKTHLHANRERYNEKNATYRASKKENTPKFIRDCPVDKQRRVFAYNLSRLLTETTGVEHHVDHMWPIADGGPHWSGNLQVIPAVDNLSKNAKVDEEVKKTIQEGLEYARQCYQRG